MNDSKNIGMSIYTTCILLVITLPVSLMLENNPTALFFVRSIGGIFLPIVCMMVFIFLPKVISLLTGKADRMTQFTVSSDGTGTAAQSSMASSEVQKFEDTVDSLKSQLEVLQEEIDSQKEKIEEQDDIINEYKEKEAEAQRMKEASSGRRASHFMGRKSKASGRASGSSVKPAETSAA